MKYRIVKVTNASETYYKIQQKILFIWVDILDKWDLDIQKFHYLDSAKEFVEKLKLGTKEEIIKVYD